MGLPIIGSVLDLGKTLIERLIPDPKMKAETMLKLAEMEQAGELKVIEGQVEINKIEAASTNWFIAGWRPAFGWVLAMGALFIVLINPVIQWKAGREGPKIPTEIVLVLGGGMLGLRTWEKGKGVEGNH